MTMIVKEILIENGIEIPRLRGYRLMSEEEPFKKDEIQYIHVNVKKGT